MHKHYPQLAGDEPQIEERPSLPSAKAFLTPTRIAKQLDWLYSTGNPNPKKVNIALEQLGYLSCTRGLSQESDEVNCAYSYSTKKLSFCRICIIIGIYTKARGRNASSFHYEVINA